MADNQTPELFGQTPWQTVGPFFHYRLPWTGWADLLDSSELGARLELTPAAHRLQRSALQRGDVSGERIEITGRVLDAEDAPVPDALLEIWQANSIGRYNSPLDQREQLPLQANFGGFGRAATLEDGSFTFRTLLPGRVPGPDGQLQAPHIAVGVLGRGLLKRLVTRIYFDTAADNASDAILAMVPATRRATLIARRVNAQADRPAIYRFDIHLQGPQETVFFDC